MRTLSLDPPFSGSIVKIRISNEYLNLRFTQISLIFCIIEKFRQHSTLPFLNLTYIIIIDIAIPFKFYIFA